MATPPTKHASPVFNTTSLLLQRLVNASQDLLANATYDVLAVNDYDNQTVPCYDNGFAYNDSGTEWYRAQNGKSRRPLPGQTDFDAFLYIVIVLSFYAISMVLLMIKYIKREEEEVSLDYYYTEFVKRERFQNPRFKNKMALEREKPLIEKAQRLALKTLVNPTENIECCRPSKSARRENGSEAARLLGKRENSGSEFTHGAGNAAVVESPREENARGHSKQGNPPDLRIAHTGGAPPVNSRQQQLARRDRDNSDRSRRGRNVFQWSPCYEMDSDTEAVSSRESSMPSSPDNPFLLSSCRPSLKNSPCCTEQERSIVRVPEVEGQVSHKQDFIVDIVYTPPETSL